MGQRKSASDHVDEELEDFSHCFTGECRINVLPTLFKVSQVIAESEDSSIRSTSFSASCTNG